MVDFEKQEKQKEVAQLEQDISGGRAKLSVIFSQQVKAEQETEYIMQQNEEVRQEMEELSAINILLREQADEQTEDNGKLLTIN